MIEFTLSEVVPALNAVLIGQDVKFIGCSTDTRHLASGALYIALHGKRFDGHQFVAQAKQLGAVAAMVEKADIGCDLPLLQVADTRKALGQLAHLWRTKINPPHIVAVTGSNGKTTVKEMLTRIFAQQGKVLATKGNLNNDIGVPLTLFGLNHEHQYAVIEMGANHAREIAYLTQLTQPTVAAITLCAPAHLEGFKDVEGVAHAKGEIFSGLVANGTAIINHDDVYAELWHRLATSHRCTSFALENTADIKAKDVHLSTTYSRFILQTLSGDIPIQLPLPGRHNIMNALAASACALACGCDLTVIQQGLQTVNAVSGRLQRHTGLHHTTLLDDTYNANPASLHAALAVLQHYSTPRWLILGDMNELGTRSTTFHQQAGRLAREFGVERLWAIGNMSQYAVDSFGEGAQHFATHAELIETIQNQLIPELTILIKGSRGMQMETVVKALRMDD